MSSRTDSNDPISQLRLSLAAKTGTCAEDWFPVFKARYGMREVFGALRRLQGEGNVVTTLFTGCTAVDSILSAGQTPRYAQIDDALLTIDVEALEVGPADHAILLQNSYGMIDEAASARCARKAHEAGAIFVEDSAHCLARMARDAQGAPLADVAIHSVGIEKQLNIGFGGAVWVNPHMADTAVRDGMREALRSCTPLPAQIARRAHHYRTHNRIMAHLPAPLARLMRRSLMATGSFEPPVCEDEKVGRLPYESHLPSDEIAQRIVEGMKALDADEARRRELTSFYARELNGQQGIWIPEAAVGVAASQSLIRFPIVLSTRAAAKNLISDLGSHGFYCVNWYCMPFFPGAQDLAPYGMSDSDPRYLAFLDRYGGVVGLPTDIDPARIDEVVDIVRRHLAE